MKELYNANENLSTGLEKLDSMRRTAQASRSGSSPSLQQVSETHTQTKDEVNDALTSLQSNIENLQSISIGSLHPATNQRLEDTISELDRLSQQLAQMRDVFDRVATDDDFGESDLHDLRLLTDEVREGTDEVTDSMTTVIEKIITEAKEEVTHIDEKTHHGEVNSQSDLIPTQRLYHNSLKTCPFCGEELDNPVIRVFDSNFQVSQCKNCTTEWVKPKQPFSVTDLTADIAITHTRRDIKNISFPKVVWDVIRRDSKDIPDSWHKYQSLTEEVRKQNRNGLLALSIILIVAFITPLFAFGGPGFILSLMFLFILLPIFAHIFDRWIRDRVRQTMSAV
ncbi:hypothetical protein [Halapricum desulfuricans]|uniref:hypothetical protein n=1 Tax=Halapricum desulfuricans TaxID=2841257 RepID=UPI001E34FA6C|nr:hypothetical protein [Halapricum desulfuricans]